MERRVLLGLALAAIDRAWVEMPVQHADAVVFHRARGDRPGPSALPPSEVQPFKVFCDEPLGGLESR